MVACAIGPASRDCLSGRGGKEEPARSHELRGGTRGRLRGTELASTAESQSAGALACGVELRDGPAPVGVERDLVDLQQVRDACQSVSRKGRPTGKVLEHHELDELAQAQVVKSCERLQRLETLLFDADSGLGALDVLGRLQGWRDLGHGVAPRRSALAGMASARPGRSPLPFASWGGERVSE